MLVARLRTRIEDLVLGAPENRLADFGGQAIFQRPLVGVADGDDPLFLRFREVVDPQPLLPTPRPGTDHRSPCLATHGAACDRCLPRCPVQAITTDGLDKTRCMEMRLQVRERFLAELQRGFDLRPSPVIKSGVRRDGFSLGCALCQCGVPCENCTPAFPVAKDAPCSI